LIGRHGGIGHREPPGRCLLDPTDWRGRLAQATASAAEATAAIETAQRQVAKNMAQMLTATKSGDARLAALKQVAMMVQRQALTLTYNDVLLLMAGCFFLALPLTPLLAKPSAGATAEAH
jgi:hypothetical protein